VKLYDCKVRLGGNVVNEVRKDKVTAAEVILMRAIHGDDAVIEIVEVGEDKRSDAEERERLAAALYDGEMLGKVFGISAIPLPREVPGVAAAKKVVPVVDVDTPVRRTGRPAKAADEAASAE
jgi:hypothetical protein